MGLFAPRAVRSLTAVYLSVHFTQDIEAGADIATGASGFIRSLAAPFPVGISAAVIVIMLPPMSIRVVTKPQVRANLLRFISFIFVFVFDCLREFRAFALLRRETGNPLNICC